MPQTCCDSKQNITEKAIKTLFIIRLVYSKMISLKQRMIYNRGFYLSRGVVPDQRLFITKRGNKDSDVYNVLNKGFGIGMEIQRVSVNTLNACLALKNRFLEATICRLVYYEANTISKEMIFIYKANHTPNNTLTRYFTSI